MAWNTPTTSNDPASKVTVTTFDEIAENQVYLKERADKVDSDLGQAVNTTDSPAFVDVFLTGLGLIKDSITTLISRVNQGVNTTSSPTFAGATFNGNIIPTSSPANTTLTRSSIGTTSIPKGIYTLGAYATASNQGIAQVATVSVQKLLNGTWTQIATTTADGLGGDGQQIANNGALYSSTGSDLRFVVTQTGSFSYNAGIVYSKI